jgi:TolA-binding protein
VILVVVAIVYFFDYQSSQTNDAAIKFATANSEYRQGNTQVAILSFQQIIDEYASDDAASRATFMLGKLNLESRNFAEAIRYFDQYLANYPNDLFVRAAALAGLGTAYENQADFANAALKYTAAADEYPDGPMADDYRLGAIRAMLAGGQNDAAEAQLSILQKDFAQSDVTKQATLLAAERGLAR